SSPHQQAQDIYLQIVSQARQPVFYRDWQVEDSIDGRFDVIVLHLFLVLFRCEEEKSRPEVSLFMRDLAEAFFADMDRSIREMGVSDTGVGKRVKAMAQASYGRMQSYRRAVTDETSLAD